MHPAIALGIFAVLVILAVWLFRPDQGLFWRWQRGRMVTERVLQEDALKHLLRCERHGLVPTINSLAGALEITNSQGAELLVSLEAHNLVKSAGDTYQLTAGGREYALHVVRAHRLWEKYLAEETGFARQSWHSQADLAEHRLTRSDADLLEAELGFPTHDLDGDPIPSAEGSLVPHGGQPLATLEPDVPATIVHLEDEPDSIYGQLIAEGIAPGMTVQLLESSSRRVRFWANGDEHVLAPIAAANISVVPIAVAVAGQIEAGRRLSDLRIGEEGVVDAISQGIPRSERRRLMDLGLLPGTVVRAEMESPSGDPTAYRVREALIALRRDQADRIRVMQREEEV